MGGARLAVLITAAVLALSAGPAAAATISVTTTVDGSAGPSQCTLRQAIYDVDSPGAPAGSANNSCAPAAFGDNTIVLGPNTYRLGQGFSFSQHGSGSLYIGPMTGQLTIFGAGEGRTVVDATLLRDRSFIVAPGASVLMNALTLAGGAARDGAFGPANGSAGAGADGGAVLNQGSLTLRDVALIANHAGDGGPGGTGGSLVPVGGTGGHGGAGGAIYNTGNLTLDGATVSGNRAGAGGPGGDGGSAGSGGGPGGDGGVGGAGGDGGGIASAGGTLTIVGSTVLGNLAGSGAGGGGGGNAGGQGAGGNGGNGGAGGGGGGISVTGGTLSVTNSTFSTDSGGEAGGGGRGGAGAGVGAAGGNGGSGGSGGDGGAIDVAGPVTATLLQTTVAGSEAGASAPGPTSTSGPPNGAAGAGGSAGSGGGVAVLSGTVTVRNSLLASNLRGNCSGSVLDGGHDLSFDGSGCPVTFASGDPKLGPLQDNGGPAQTMYLGRGSAAVDQVPARGAGCPATDERGVARPGGPACDIGAYEVAAPVVAGATARATGVRTVQIIVIVTANAARGTAWVRYGRTKSYARETGVKAVSGVGPTTVTLVLRGLDPRRTYHYQVVVSSMDGAAQTGDIALAVPVVRSLRLVPSPFVRGRAATVSYRDSRSGVTVFVVQRRVRRRWITVEAFGHRDRPGRDALSFGRRLRPGVYRLEVTPHHGRTTGLLRSVRFRVLP